MSRIEIDLDASADVLTGAITILQFMLEKRKAEPAPVILKRGPGRPKRSAAIQPPAVTVAQPIQVQPSAPKTDSRGVVFDPALHLEAKNLRGEWRSLPVEPADPAPVDSQPVQEIAEKIYSAVIEPVIEKKLVSPFVILNRRVSFATGDGSLTEENMQQMLSHFGLKTFSELAAHPEHWETVSAALDQLGIPNMEGIST